MKILKNKIFITLMTLLMVVGVSFLIIPGKENKPFHQLSKAEKSILKKKNKKARGDYFFNITKDPATNKIPDNMRAKELKFANDLQKKSSSRGGPGVGERGRSTSPGGPSGLADPPEDGPRGVKMSYALGCMPGESEKTMLHLRFL